MTMPLNAVFAQSRCQYNRVCHDYAYVRVDMVMVSAGTLLRTQSSHSVLI